MYTYNWVAPWHPEYYPGIFTVSVNGLSGREVGKESATWNWEYAGEFIIMAAELVYIKSLRALPVEEENDEEDEIELKKATL